MTQISYPLKEQKCVSLNKNEISDFAAMFFLDFNVTSVISNESYAMIFR